MDLIDVYLSQKTQKHWDKKLLPTNALPSNHTLFRDFSRFIKIEQLK